MEVEASSRFPTAQSSTGWCGRFHVVVILLFVLFYCTGCASLTLPVPGVPVYRIPQSLLAKPKDDKQTMNLALLGKRAGEYRLAAGDVLGVWTEEIGAVRSSPPPIQYFRLANGSSPGVGVPLEIQQNGTIDLPQVGPVAVEGQTLIEAKQAIRQAYVDQGVFQPDFKGIIVSLAQPRVEHVLVLRQEADVSVTGIQQQSQTAVRITRFKRGTGYALDLPANKSDILNALSLSGGLPGLDAINAIIIYRGCFTEAAERDGVLKQLDAGVPTESLSVKELRIPVRMRPGDPLPFKSEDVALRTGDVVFIEARDPDVYYTGGLLPTGEFILPRDYDLDIVEAVAAVRGPLLSGGLATGTQLFGAQILGGDIGGPSPSLLLVLRRTPDGGQIPIRIDLNHALRDPSERILVQAGDVLLLQQTPDEAIARYLSGVIKFQTIWRMFSRGDASGTAQMIVP